MSDAFVWVVAIGGTLAEALLRSPRVARVMSLFWLIGGGVVISFFLSAAFRGDWWETWWNAVFAPFWLFNAWVSHRKSEKWEVAA